MDRGTLLALYYHGQSLQTISRQAVTPPCRCAVLTTAPVQVFEHQHHRLVAGQGCECLGQLPQHARLGRAGRGALQRLPGGRVAQGRQPRRPRG
jgi:hypothetical protein